MTVIHHWDQWGRMESGTVSSVYSSGIQSNIWNSDDGAVTMLYQSSRTSHQVLQIVYSHHRTQNDTQQQYSNTLNIFLSHGKGSAESLHAYPRSKTICRHAVHLKFYVCKWRQCCRLHAKCKIQLSVNASSMTNRNSHGSQWSRETFFKLVWHL